MASDIALTFHVWLETRVLWTSDDAARLSISVLAGWFLLQCECRVRVASDVQRSFITSYCTKMAYFIFLHRGRAKRLCSLKQTEVKSQSESLRSSHQPPHSKHFVPVVCILAAHGRVFQTQELLFVISSRVTIKWKKGTFLWRGFTGSHDSCSSNKFLDSAGCPPSLMSRKPSVMNTRCICSLVEMLLIMIYDAFTFRHKKHTQVKCRLGQASVCHFVTWGMTGRCSTVTPGGANCAPLQFRPLKRFHL